MTDDERWGDRDLEERLRGALRAEAGRVQPADRLDEIRSHLEPASHRRLAGWVLPIGAAAAVAAIAVVAWVGLRPGTPAPAPVAPVTSTATATNTPTATGTPTVSGSTAPSPTPSATSNPAATGPAQPLVEVAVPVFHVAPVAGPNGYGVVREFMRVKVPQGASTVDRANAALAAAVALPAGNPNQYLSAWPTGTQAVYVSLPSPELGVQLSNRGVTGLPPHAQRLAVQALVWTVTAVFQQDAPVPVSVRTGGDIFESVPANVYKRPAPDQWFQEVAPIWVDTPYAGQSLPASSRIVASGQACTFEANVLWELRQNGKAISSGSTTASSGCPQQGSWSVDLGKRASGSYQLAVSERSAKDGSVTAQVVVPFTVQ